LPAAKFIRRMRFAQHAAGRKELVERPGCGYRRGFWRGGHVLVFFNIPNEVREPYRSTTADWNGNGATTRSWRARHTPESDSRGAKLANRERRDRRGASTTI